MAFNIFISYAREDEKYKDELVRHLAPLKNQGLITAWYDQLIHKGDDWEQEIRKAMERCNMALLLLSENFFSSEFITNIEVPRLMERRQKENIRINPILVLSCAWQVTELASLTIAPNNGIAVDLYTRKAGGRRQIWTNIALDLARWIKENQNTSIPPAETDLDRLPRPTTILVGRGARLDQLDALIADAGKIAVGIIAPGGYGKSALTDAWVERFNPRRKGIKAFAWSFYSQGSHQQQNDSALFFNAALSFFGYRGLLTATSEEKAEALGQLLAKRPFLLILDGVEPLQYPPETLGGRFSDAGMYRLMQFLGKTQSAQSMTHQLVLITSRQPIRELRDKNCYQEWDLERLSKGEGVAFLSSLGVKGQMRVMDKMVEIMHGHALGLTLLGRLLSQQYGGDIASCVEVAELQASGPPGVHAERIMDHYDEVLWLNKPAERAFLRLIGLFDRPMEAGPWAALRANASVAQPLRALSDPDFDKMIEQLTHAGLLLASDKSAKERTWDAHPLVREHFGQRFAASEESFQQANEVLFDYFQSVPDKDQPDTLEELTPLYRAVQHGCRAGAYDKALKAVYYERILHKKEGYSKFNLGAYGPNLAVLSSFFMKGWEIPVSQGLSEDDQAWLLAEAAFCLMSLGRMVEAVVPRQVGMRCEEKQEDWKNVAHSAESLVALLISVGELAEARSVAESGVVWAQRTTDQLQQMSSRLCLAETCCRLGDWAVSVQQFQEVERLVGEYDQTTLHLYALPGVWYCTLLLEQSRDEATLHNVLSRGQESQKILSFTNHLLSIAWDDLIQARSLAALGDRRAARERFEAAVTGMQHAKKVQYMPDILLHRAAFLRDCGESEKSRNDLEEALDISMQCGMILYESEARLLEMHLLLDASDIQAAKQALDRADELIEKMGYGLRYANLYMAKARYFHCAQELELAKQWLKKAEERIEEIGQRGLTGTLEKLTATIMG